MTKKERISESNIAYNRFFCNPGGIVVRPHRLSLAPERLNKNLFLKCNEHVVGASELL